MQDPVITVKTLLEDNWNAANTRSVTPAFSTGWFDRAAQQPQVTVTGITEVPLRGGETGYSGIQPDGSGPTQTRGGSVDVGCWAIRATGQPNPKELTWLFSEEIKRIVKANYNLATDLIWITFGPRRLLVETEPPPAVYHRVCEIEFGYLETP